MTIRGDGDEDTEVATSREMDELKALEQTRSRLETTLGRDENWRALNQAGTQGGEDGVARRTRNTRLEMALADNPFYQAWKHVSEAIKVLRDRGAEPAAEMAPAGDRIRLDQPDKPEPLPTAPLPGLALDGAGDRWSGDLPQDIVDRIRRGPPEAAADDGAEIPGGDVAEPPLEKLETKSLEEPTGARAAPNAPKIPSVAPAAARAEEKAPVAMAAPPAASGERMDRAFDDPVPTPAEPRPPVADDWEEATVTFVTREPRRSSAAHLGAERKASLFERLQDVGGGPEPSGDAFAPRNEEVEEAEVTIVTAEGITARHKAEERAGALRRFRKALSGD
jgi:hypothetical protein